MNRPAFFSQVCDTVQALLPQDLRDFETRATNTLMKLYYGGNPKVHYEVWFQSRTGRIELGLHFEDELQKNDALLRYFDERFLEVIAALGPGLEPEKWTKSWARVHQSLPMAPIDDRLVREISGRLAHMIEVLEPMVREHDAK